MSRLHHPKIINDKILVGRDEWFGLPNLNIPVIKARIDSGAKTSSIHAFNIQVESEEGIDYAVFDIHPLQGNDQLSMTCRAPIVDCRTVMSSNGSKEKRYVIETMLSIARKIWKIEVTLSNRDPLKYRMLVGREAMVGNILIDPELSCNQAKYTGKDAFTLLTNTIQIQTEK